MCKLCQAVVVALGRRGALGRLEGPYYPQQKQSSSLNGQHLNVQAVVSLRPPGKLIRS